MVGRRTRESNVSTGSDSTLVIGKMFAGEIEVAKATAVLRSSPGRHDQTLIESGTRESGEIGNAPIGGDRIVIDPIASGSPAPLARRYRATATGEIRNAPTVATRIVTDQIVRGGPIPPDR